MPPKHIEGLQNKKCFLGKINPLALGEQHTESRRRDPVSLSNPSARTNRALTPDSYLFFVTTEHQESVR